MHLFTLYTGISSLSHSLYILYNISNTLPLTFVRAFTLRCVRSMKLASLYKIRGCFSCFLLLLPWVALLEYKNTHTH